MDLQILIRYTIARFLNNYKVVGIIKLAYPNIYFEKNKLYQELILTLKKHISPEDDYLQMYFNIFELVHSIYDIDMISYYESIIRMNNQEDVELEIIKNEFIITQDSILNDIINCNYMNCSKYIIFPYLKTLIDMKKIFPICKYCRYNLTNELNKTFFCWMCLEIISCSNCKIQKNCKCESLKMYYYSELKDYKKKIILSKYNFLDKYFKIDLTDEVIVMGLAKLLNVKNFGAKFINFILHTDNPNIIKIKFKRNDKLVLVFEHFYNSFECTYENCILKIAGDNYNIACRIIFNEVVKYVTEKLENNIND